MKITLTTQRFNKQANIHSSITFTGTVVCVCLMLSIAGVFVGFCVCASAWSTTGQSNNPLVTFSHAGCSNNEWWIVDLGSMIPIFR